MKKTQLFGLTLLFVSMISCGQQTENKTVEPKNGWNLIDESDFTLQYPKEWELDESGNMGTHLILLSKQTSPKDQFKENVNLVIQDTKDQDIDLDEYVEISEEQIRTMLTNSEIVESKRQKSHDNEFHKVVFTGDQGVYHLKFEQYYFVKNGKAYALTLTCEVDEFDEYKETGEEIMNSFSLK